MTGKSVILLPVGAGDDGAHSQNEKIDIRNYIEGVMILLFKKKNLNLLSSIIPVWWPGVKNSPNIAHACRKRQLK
jgi:hypothetical protein